MHPSSGLYDTKHLLDEQAEISLHDLAEIMKKKNDNKN